MIPQFLRPIPGHPAYLITEYGKVWSKKRGKYLATQYSQRYPYVLLGRGETHTIHRLVAKAWLPNPDNLPVVHHKDNDSTNNHYSNLEWCTHQYNTRQGPVIKLSDEDVAEIKRMYGTRLYTQHEIANKFGVSQAYVWLLCNGLRR